MTESDVRFRLMGIDDYDAVIALWQGVEGLRLRDADSREGIERYLLRNEGLSFLAEIPSSGSGRKVVGTVMAGHDGKRGYLQHLCVSAECRRQSIGARLTTLSLDALAKEGILKTYLFALNKNAAGQDYWRGRGWQERNDFSVFSWINSDEDNV